MLDHHTRLMYYKRPEVQEAIVESAANREIAVKYGDKGFGRRPDTLQYRRDVLELAKQGATSFHASEELWPNPLQIDTSLSKREMDSLRIGWDLVLDIDCPFLEYSKIAADVLVKALKHHDIEAVSVKFSGNHGFHIGIPFKAFPEFIEGKETRQMFPEGARKIAQYLQEFIRLQLANKLLEFENISAISKRMQKPFDELMLQDNFNPYAVLNIDTILISSRHLYRMEYSFNEKSGLVSIPVKPGNILEFEKESAKSSDVVISGLKFLDTSNIHLNEAAKLIIQAFDFCSKMPEEYLMPKQSQGEEVRPEDVPQSAIPQNMFPPCINKLLLGIEDGKKRSLFALVNFLRCSGWGYEQIEALLNEWNQKNPQPLREVLIKGQVRYHKQQKKTLLPPNCDNSSYYKDLHLCSPDNLCRKIKNPVNYAKIRAKIANEEANSKNAKDNPNLTEEQKKFIEERLKQEREFRAAKRKELKQEQISKQP